MGPGLRTFVSHATSFRGVGWRLILRSIDAPPSMPDRQYKPKPSKSTTILTPGMRSCGGGGCPLFYMILEMHILNII